MQFRISAVLEKRRYAKKANNQAEKILLGLQ